METKVFKLEVKSLQDDGSFEGYLAVNENIDSGRDRLHYGAFTKTLLERETYPLYHMHRHEKIPSGDFRATEDSIGLKVKGQIYINDFEGKPLSEPRQLHMAMKRRAVTGMSMGFDPIKTGEGKDAQGRIRELLEVKLYEGSIVPWPMNYEAQIIDVKMEGKPFPSEHACRLQDPKKYDRFTRGDRKHKGKTYSIIYGWRKKDGEDVSEEQTYRYGKDAWTADEAQAHCKDHGGNFEAASGKSIQSSLSEIISWKDACCICFDDEQRGLATKAVESLNALLNPEPEKSTQKGGEPQDKQTKPDDHLVSICEEAEKIYSILGGK